MEKARHKASGKGRNARVRAAFFEDESITPPEFQMRTNLIEILEDRVSRHARLRHGLPRSRHEELASPASRH
jgi:hypothetical protein